MWVMLLSGGVVPAYDASSTRLGFITQPPLGYNASSTRIGYVTQPPRGLSASSTRIGFITRRTS